MSQGRPAAAAVAAAWRWVEARNEGSAGTERVGEARQDGHGLGNTCRRVGFEGGWLAGTSERLVPRRSSEREARGALIEGSHAARPPPARRRPGCPDLPSLSLPRPLRPSRRYLLLLLLLLCSSHAAVSAAHHHRRRTAHPSLPDRARRGSRLGRQGEPPLLWSASLLSPEPPRALHIWTRERAGLTCHEPRSRACCLSPVHGTHQSTSQRSVPRRPSPSSTGPVLALPPSLPQPIRELRPNPDAPRPPSHPRPAGRDPHI